MNKTTPALSVQIGGSHYKDCAIQPVQFIEANKLAFLEGCVVKRLARHDKPTGKGRQDIEKAIHELQLVLELRYPMPANDNKATAMESAGEVVTAYSPFNAINAALDNQAEARRNIIACPPGSFCLDEACRHLHRCKNV